MRCPKCKYSNPAGATECDSCGVVFAQLESAHHSNAEINHNCPTCGAPGYLSHATNGAGPWYCRQDFQ